MKMLEHSNNLDLISWDINLLSTKKIVEFLNSTVELLASLSGL